MALTIEKLAPFLPYEVDCLYKDSRRCLTLDQDDWINIDEI